MARGGSAPQLASPAVNLLDAMDQKVDGALDDNSAGHRQDVARR